MPTGVDMNDIACAKAFEFICCCACSPACDWAAKAGFM
jgi:hypothetical protein